MAHEIVMPQLGLSMDNGKIIQWLKEPGEEVKAGEILLEVESDKAIVEVQATQHGKLHILRGKQDGDIPIGTVIGYLLTEGEQPRVEIPPQPFAVMENGKTPTRDLSRIGAVSLDSQTTPKHSGIVHSSPRAQRLARELGIDWQVAIGTGPQGRIKERDIIRLSNELKTKKPAIGRKDWDEEINISPIAKGLAMAVGLEPYELAQQYPNKRIERADIEQTIGEIIQKSRNYPVLAKADSTLQVKRQKMRSIRSKIAEKMAHSAHTTAPVTLMLEADCTEIVRIREDLKRNKNSSIIPSYQAFLVFIVGKALIEHPNLNTTLDGDEIIYHDSINIGIAVDTERGLVVPVIRDIQTKNLRGVSEEMEALLARVSDGKALPDELHGGSFTITNLGMYDIENFTPIINPPECAVLGVGTLSQRMRIFDQQPSWRTVMPLSLTFDHRIVDGAPAARFLQTIKRFLETPDLWLQL